jgi:hypothetical protein
LKKEGKEETLLRSINYVTGDKTLGGYEQFFKLAKIETSRYDLEGHS